MIKPGCRPGGRWKRGTPFGGWRHHLYPKGSMSLDFRVALLPYIHCCHRLTGFSGRFRSLTNPVRWCNSGSFAAPLSSVGRAKGKRLYFSRVPLRGTPRSGKGCTRVNMPMTLYRCSTQRLTSPDLHILCRMCTVSLWVLSIVPHDAAGKHREIYSAP